PAELTARRLAAEADAAGGRDNTTAVVVDVMEADRSEGSLTERFRKITTPSVDLSQEGEGPHTERVMAVISTSEADSEPSGPA
ncbi:MAG: hypothetical protein KDB13_09725, partial [Microthrixaceae bacterium]|nr:hypothetical protein [Microthrixaceae bacterium]